MVGLSGAKLVIKLNRRKRMASGSRLVRAGICDEYARDSLELHIPKGRQWPIHSSRAGTENGR